MTKSVEHFSKHSPNEKLYSFKNSFTGIYGQPQTSSTDYSYSKLKWVFNKVTECLNKFKKDFKTPYMQEVY